jgi:hypothetical protein
MQWNMSEASNDSPFPLNRNATVIDIFILLLRMIDLGVFVVSKKVVIQKNKLYVKKKLYLKNCEGQKAP